MLVLFAPLLAGKSTHALATSYATGCCTAAACWLPWLVLACIAYIILRAARVLLRFRRSASAHACAATRTPESAAETPDPLFRSINRGRAALGLPLIDRFADGFLVQPADTAESMITSRILRQPFGFWGHDLEREPIEGARALYLVWLGDARGPAPWYVLSTLILNVELQIVLSMSPFEAIFKHAWMVQGVLVLAMIAQAMMWLVLFQPTSDRLLGVLDMLSYTLHAIASFFAFAAYHIDGVDTLGALAASDGLMAASVWILAGFAAYDAFAVSVLNRIHREGLTPLVICKAVGSIALSFVRTFVLVVSTLTARPVVGQPEDPHAARGGSLVPSAPHTRTLRRSSRSSPSSRSNFRRPKNRWEARLAVALGGSLFEDVPAQGRTKRRLAQLRSFSRKVTMRVGQKGRISLQFGESQRIAESAELYQV